MQVGYYRTSYDNPRTRRINAITYQYYGLELICFGPEDVDIDKQTINGKVFKEGEWIEKTVSPPLIINNTPFRKKSDKAIFDFLDNNSYLMFRNYGDKEELNNTLLNDKKYGRLIIPTITLDSFESIIKSLAQFKNIIIKPKKGSQGRSIYSIVQDDQVFIVTYKSDTKSFNLEDLKELYNEKFKNKNFIIQKEIQSRTKQNQPFDIRVQFEKNGKGRWVRAQSYVRLGTSEQIVSNISQGGSMTRLNSFLKYHHNSHRKEYREKLKQVTKGLPERIEEIYNTEITSLAFDFGLENGDYYLFETNYFPGGTFARGEIAMLRAAYTKHLLETKFQKKVKFPIT